MKLTIRELKKATKYIVVFPIAVMSNNRLQDNLIRNQN